MKKILGLFLSLIISLLFITACNNNETKHIVTFYGNGGSYISGQITQMVEHGKSAVAPIFKKEGYVLSWDRDFDYITEDITIAAIWEEGYLVIFDGNGGEYVSGELTQVVKYGNAASPPRFKKEGYILTWDKEFTNISEEIIITAVWEPIEDIELAYIWHENKYLFFDIWEAVGNLPISEVIFGTTPDNLEVLLDISWEEYAQNIDFIWDTEYLINFQNTPLALELSNSDNIPEAIEALNNYFENIRGIRGSWYRYKSTNIIITNEMFSLGYVFDKDIVYSEDTNAYFANSGENLLRYNGVEGNYEIPNSVTSIGELAFSNSNSLTSIILPNSIISIGSAAFHGCSSLTSITIPSSVNSIGSAAFYGCNSLTSITIPEGVTSIGNSTFYGCSSLTSIILPNSTTSIGDYIFMGCSNLTSITIPEGVTRIGDSIFYNCSNLTSIIMPSSVTFIGDSAFSGCSSLTSISIPDGVTSIGRNAFTGCSSLISITIPDGVTSIGNSTFYGCSSLTSIILPNSITSIGDYTFFGCSILANITINAVIPPSFDSDLFYNTSSELKIYVPVESVDAYKSIGGWNNYADKIYAIE
jgi:hypothetical protein